MFDVEYEIPDEYGLVGGFLGPTGQWFLSTGQWTTRSPNPVDLLPGYLERLRSLSQGGIVERFQENGGIGSPRQIFDNMPRMKVRDGKGDLELVLNGYIAASGPAVLSVRSTEPERAGKLLAQHFTPQEFQTPYRQ